MKYLIMSRQMSSLVFFLGENIQHRKGEGVKHRRRIELEDKAKVVASVLRRIGGQNPCRASYFVLVFLKQTVEFNHPPCRDSCFASIFLKQKVEFNCLFQKDRGKTASVARNLSPSPMRRPLP